MTNTSNPVINNIPYHGSLPILTVPNPNIKTLGLSALQIPGNYPKVKPLSNPVNPPFYGIISSDKFRKKAPYLKNWKDVTTNHGVSIRLPDTVELFDCIDLIPLTNGRNIHLAYLVESLKFVYANPTAFQVNLFEKPYQIRDDCFSNIVTHLYSHRLFDIITEALDADRPVIINCHTGIYHYVSNVIA